MPGLLRTHFDGTHLREHMVPSVLVRVCILGKGQPRIKTGPAEIKKVERWNKAAEESGERIQVFSASLGDVFDTEVPDAWRDLLFDLIRRTPHIDRLLLTKRPNKAVEYMKGKVWPANAWFGVTFENNQVLNRLEHLRAIPAPVRFLSMEPLLEEVCPDFTGVDWVIVGGESGANFRMMRKKWVLKIKKLCEDAKVPFFFKQWGGSYSTKYEHLLEGKEYYNFPTPKPDRLVADATRQDLSKNTELTVAEAVKQTKSTQSKQ